MKALCSEILVNTYRQQTKLWYWINWLLHDKKLVPSYWKLGLQEIESLWVETFKIFCVKND